MDNIKLNNNISVLNKKLEYYRNIYRSSTPGYKKMLEASANIVKKEIESIGKRLEKEKKDDQLEI